MLAYHTGSYDGLHAGHVAFLDACRKAIPNDCRLIIGLTTDELCARQKRPPLFSYEHRRAVLAAIRGVDAVIPHHGDPKPTAHKKLKYDILLTGAEYFGLEEYTCMENTVRVLYIECPLNRAFSSSALKNQMIRANAARFHMIAQSTCGDVFVYDDQPSPVVIKTVRLSQREWESNGANVYELPTPAPRNWKRRGERHVHPMLPGFNSRRELTIQPLICGRPWCTTLDVQSDWTRAQDGPRNTAAADWSHIKRDKAEPKQVWLIRQRHGGDTLHEWITANKDKPEFAARFKDILSRVRDICVELATLGIVHGDVHAYNVLVAAPKRSGPVIPGDAPPEPWAPVVSVIDFGWSTYESMPLDAAELEEHRQRLRLQFDLTHFTDSLDWAYGDEPWFTRSL